MNLSKRAKFLLGLLTFGTLTYICVPLIVVALNSFNPSKTFSWPPQSFSTVWWSRLGESNGVLTAIFTATKVGLGATAIALILGSCIAFAVSRYSFYGKNTLSLLVIFPIALPGIITGIALNTTFHTLLDPLGKELALWTVVVGHATFCIVVVYNNVLARLRRMGQNLEEASQDLGANIFQTFRYQAVELKACNPRLLDDPQTPPIDQCDSFYPLDSQCPTHSMQQSIAWGQNTSSDH